MRFSLLAVLGLCSSVFALPTANADLNSLDERQILSDTTVVDSTIATIKAATLKLDAAINKINSSDLTILLPLDGQATALDNTIKAQTKRVKSSPPIGFFSALPVAFKAQDLINTVKKTLSDLKSKREFAIQASITDLVVGDLKKLKASADLYVDALKAKAPSLLGFIVDFDKKQIDDAFNDAISYYTVSDS